MNYIILALTSLILLSDQLSKFFITQNLRLNESTEIIKNICYITLVHNTGAAFGIFRNQTLFFIIVSVLAIILILVYIKKRRARHPVKDMALALILGGALGNLIDRLRFGYVIDFFDFKIWPVFNIADSAITIGTLILIFSLAKHSAKQ